MVADMHCHCRCANDNGVLVFRIARRDMADRRHTPSIIIFTIIIHITGPTRVTMIVYMGTHRIRANNNGMCIGRITRRVMANHHLWIISVCQSL